MFIQGILIKPQKFLKISILEIAKQLIETKLKQLNLLRLLMILLIVQFSLYDFDFAEYLTFLS